MASAFLASACASLLAASTAGSRAEEGWAYPQIAEPPIDAEALEQSQRDPCFRWFYEAVRIFRRYQLYASDAVARHRSCDRIYADYEREIRALGNAQCDRTAGSMAADRQFIGHLFAAQQSWNDTGHESWIICNEDPLTLSARQFFRFHLRLFHAKCEPSSVFPIEPVTETQSRGCKQGRAKPGAPVPSEASSTRSPLAPSPAPAPAAADSAPGPDIPREITFPGPHPAPSRTVRFNKR